MLSLRFTVRSIQVETENPGCLINNTFLVAECLKGGAKDLVNLVLGVIRKILFLSGSKKGFRLGLPKLY